LKRIDHMVEHGKPFREPITTGLRAPR
jgi:hypothetical protein